LPQTRTLGDLNVKKFYVRRAFRIGLPALIAIIIYESLKIMTLDGINKTVFWSVICEAIYYALYPLILILGRRIGWKLLIMAAYLAAIVLCLIHLQLIQDPDRGYVALEWKTFIVGLPCWILGCWLAENRAKFSQLKFGEIWAWRATIFITAFCLNAARFHVHSVFASTCITLDIFALLATAWIGFELSTAKKLGVNSLLERTGKWSFSIYLIHPLGGPVLALIGIYEVQASETYLLFRVGFCLLASYCFYLAVERPAHKLAIAASRYKFFMEKPTVFADPVAK
jgi:peptidoglycan/LPS O-acetylase OafA/YrhL